MPMIKLTAKTMQLIRAQALAGFRFACTARELKDGSRNVPIDDEVAMTIATERLPGESDDDVVSRLVRNAIGRKNTISGRTASSAPSGDPS
jgi:hypothetical protein